MAAAYADGMAGFVNPGMPMGQAARLSNVQMPRQTFQGASSVEAGIEAVKSTRGHGIALGGVCAALAILPAARRRRGRRVTSASKQRSAVIRLFAPRPAELPPAVEHKSTGEVEVTMALVAAAAAAFVASDPAAAQEAVTAAAGAVAEAVSAVDDVDVEAIPTESGDWFEPLIKFNAGVIAGIDDLVEDQLHIPNSFGFAIIFYTALIKLVTYPLNSSATRTNAIMQLVKPKIEQIQRKYKNDQETQNRMLLRLYDDCGVNPLGGCLPSIVQFPIFIGLYRSISKLAEINPKFREPFLWIPSLGGPVDAGQPNLDWLLKSQSADHFEPLVGWGPAAQYCILPAMLVVSQFLTQKYNNPQQANAGGPAGFITGLFPIIIGYSTLVTPQGMGVYWLCNNLFTQATTFIIRKGLEDEFPEYKLLLDGTAAKDAEEKKKKLEQERKLEDEAALMGPGVGFAMAMDDEQDAKAKDKEEKDLEPVVATKAAEPAPKKVSDAEYRRQAKKLASKRRRRR